MKPQVVLTTLIGILLLACSTTASPAEGVFLSKWGTGGVGDRDFHYPNDVAVASDGSVYVADTANHRIYKFTSDGVFISKWGTEECWESCWGDGQFDTPEGIAVASDGSVYVADTDNHRIQKFAPGP